MRDGSTAMSDCSLKFYYACEHSVDAYVRNKTMGGGDFKFKNTHDQPATQPPDQPSSSPVRMSACPPRPPRLMQFRTAHKR